MGSLILFSGGWESVFCYLKNKNKKDTTCLFLDYGQPYLKEERVAVAVLKKSLLLNVIERKVPLIKQKKGTFLKRNRTFFNLASNFNPDEIVFGTRNIFPFFDKHGDSNLWFARKEAKRIGIPIRTPAAGLLKAQIKKTVLNAGISEEQIFSSEGYNYGNL